MAPPRSWTPPPSRPPAPPPAVRSPAPSSAAPSPVAPVAAVKTAASPEELWTAVVRSVADRPAIGKLAQNLVLVAFDDRGARLTPRPGYRDLAKLVTPRILEQLAAVFQQITGRTTKVILDQPPVDAPSTPAPGGMASQRQKALALPLVRQIMDLFDATVIDVRPEGSTPPASAPTPSTGPRPASPIPGPGPLRPPAVGPVDTPDEFEDDDV